jgi:hypothetical protein
MDAFDKCPDTCISIVVTCLSSFPYQQCRVLHLEEINLSRLLENFPFPCSTQALAAGFSCLMQVCESLHFLMSSYTNPNSVISRAGTQTGKGGTGDFQWPLAF